MLSFVVGNSGWSELKGHFDERVRQLLWENGVFAAAQTRAQKSSINGTKRPDRVQLGIEIRASMLEVSTEWLQHAAWSEVGYYFRN